MKDYDVVNAWRDNFPITDSAMRGLLKKRTGGAEAGLSRAESVLLAACQFWAAVAARELALYLASDPVARLLVAFEAFSEIGAIRVATALRRVLSKCSETPSPSWLRERTIDLQATLVDTEDPVDHLIARFAADYSMDPTIGDPGLHIRCRPHRVSQDTSVAYEQGFPESALRSEYYQVKRGRTF